MNGIGGPKCAKCGRFLSAAHATLGYHDAGYASGYHIQSVRGDCYRCGKDCEATREGDSGMWWSWDMWDIAEDFA